MPGSTVSGMSGDGVSCQFPSGLRVLVVDDDTTCLTILEKMLRNCMYEVTKCNRAEVALTLLREKKNGFDIVISDVHMPDMDGFKLLEQIGLEMDLPVIMMSADDSKHVVMKGVTHGACDYLIKPVSMEALRNIWQHIVRKRKHEWKDFEPSRSAEDGERQAKQAEDTDYSSSANESNFKNSKRRKEEDVAEEREDSASLKKPRVVWSVQLHQQFVAAVNQLGLDKAVPKKILELMNVPGLTRENVASHLQKFRIYLRRLTGSQNQSGVANPFMATPEAAFSSFSSINAIDFQDLASTSQVPSQTLATLQVGRSSNKNLSSLTNFDQRNIFSVENLTCKFGEGQNTGNKQMNLLHGVPTNVEPNQLANFQQFSYTLEGTSNSQISQKESLAIPMGHNHSISKQPAGPYGLETGILARNGVRTQVSQTSSPIVNFSMNQKGLACSHFPVGANTGISTLTSTLEMKGSSVGPPVYDVLNVLNHQKSRDWPSQSVSFSNVGIASSGLLQQGFASSQMSSQNQNSVDEEAMFSVGDGSGYFNGSKAGQEPWPILRGNSFCVESEKLADGTQAAMFPEQFTPDNLIAALLHQQESFGVAGHGFDFDTNPFNNLSA